MAALTRDALKTELDLGVTANGIRANRGAILNAILTDFIDSLALVSEVSGIPTNILDLLAAKFDKTSVDIDNTLAADSDILVASQKAIKAFVNAALAGVTTGLDPQAGIDCSTNPNYPAASQGDLYFVTVAGKIGGASGTSVLVGDFFYASADNAGGTQAAVGSSWTVVPLGTLGQAILSLANTFTMPQAISVTTAAAALTLTSSEAGNLPGPSIFLKRNSATPAINDFLSEIKFLGNSSTGVERTYADIFAFIKDQTNASEDAWLLFGTIVAGSLGSRMTIGAGVFTPNASGGDKGIDTVNATTLYEAGALIPDIPYLATTTLGSNTKTAARVATTTTGAWATAFADGTTHDGVVVATGDAILIKDQFYSAAVSDPAQNGKWLVPASGPPVTRVTDVDTGAEMVNAIIPVTLGTTQAGTSWVCTTPGTITLGIDSTGGSTRIAFAAYSGAPATTRSNRQNRSNTVWAEEYGLDNTGVSATAHTAIQRAILEAFARDRGEVRLPPGLLNYGGTMTVINENASRKIRVIGSGRGTRIKKSAATGIWNQIGQNTHELTGGTRTGGVTFESMDWLPSVLMTGDEIFNTKFSKDLAFKDMHFGEPSNTGVFRAFSFGVGSGAGNNSTFIDIEDCPLIATADAGQADVALIQLGSCGSINIRGGGRSDGNDLAKYIQHADTGENADGIYVYSQFCAGFRMYIDSIGLGLSNVTWNLGQCDGVVTGFNANAIAGGENKKWDILGAKIINGSGDKDQRKGIRWATAAGGRAASLSVVGCRFDQLTSYAIEIQSTIGASAIDAVATIVGNTMAHCGNGKNTVGADTPTELIRVLVNGFGVFQGNTGHLINGGAGSPYTYGINWSGGSVAAKRKGTGQNIFLGAATGQENGTM